MLTEAARFMSYPDIKRNFKEFHTRAMKRQFKARLSNIAAGIYIVHDNLMCKIFLIANNPFYKTRLNPPFFSENVCTKSGI